MLQILCNQLDLLPKIADVNECTSPTACMGLNTVCNNTNGSFSCDCKAGYSPAGKDTKTAGCAGEDSSERGTCINAV
jgi:hypothetical protein